MKYIVSLGAGEEQAFAINTAMSKGLKVIAFDMKECDYSLVKPDLFYNISIHEKEKIADIIFGDMPIKKKRIAIRKLRKDGLSKEYMRLFLKLLEYIEQV